MPQLPCIDGLELELRLPPRFGVQSEIRSPPAAVKGIVSVHSIYPVLGEQPPTSVADETGCPSGRPLRFAPLGHAGGLDGRVVT